jgi:hypothetical protein
MSYRAWERLNFHRTIWGRLHGAWRRSLAGRGLGWMAQWFVDGIGESAK